MGMKLCACQCHTTGRECPMCKSRWAHECRAKPTPDLDLAGPAAKLSEPAALSIPGASHAAQLRDIAARFTYDSPCPILMNERDRLALIAGAASIEEALKRDEQKPA